MAELKEKPTINSLEFAGADGPITINSIEEDNTRLNSIDDDQKTLMEKKGYAMVGNKGHSFPMLQKDPVEIQKEKMMKAEGTQPPTVNRAGVPEKTLVNNPNVNQPMDKISANQFSREQMFGKMAMDPGQKFEQPGATTTPVAPTFPNQQGSFAAYDNPMRIDEKLDEQTDSMMKVGDAVSDASQDAVDAMGMYSGPGSQETPKLGRMSMNMYDGLNLTERQEDNLNPNLKAAIEAKEAEGTAMYEAPALIDYDAASRVARKERKINKIQSKASAKQHKQDAKKARNQAIKHKVKSKIHNFKATQAHKKELKGKAPAKFSMSKPAEKIEYIQNSSDSPLSMKNRFNHAHTKITKSNVNSAMKDDAAHISYLKRDINYDNKHGGSNKQMTADEKHISKLAGDIKYDVKKKRKYDNV